MAEQKHMSEGNFTLRLAAIFAAGAVLLAPSLSFAYHDTLGRESSIAGDTLIEVVIPIAVVVVAAMIGLGFWGRKKSKSKSKHGKPKSRKPKSRR